MSGEPSSLVQVVAGGVRWNLRADVRERLIGPHGLRLEEWLRNGQARVVKHGPHRTVYHIALSGLNFYLKHFRLNDVRAWFRQLVRPPKAQMEFDRALGIAARQVPTVVPLGVGVGFDGEKQGESYLVTHTLDNVVSLDDFIEKILPTVERCRLAAIRFRLADALGRLMAHLHEAGVLHHDLHAANILIRLSSADEPRLFLVDLHAVRLGTSLGWTTSRKNLVILNRWFSLRVSRPDRLRFWSTYCSARPTLFGAMHPKTSLALAADVERRTWNSNREFWRHRDRRSLVTNRYYRRVRGVPATGYTVGDLDADLVDAFLQDPDQPFHRPGVTILKNGRSSTVIEFDLNINGELKRVIYKRFRITSWHDRWIGLFKRSSALRSWIFGHGLRERALPTARPLAVFHRKQNGLCGEGYLLTEKLQNTVNLRRWIDDLGHRTAIERCLEIRRMIDRLAKLVLDLHQRNLSQRDLKASNILVDPQKLWLIDLVGVTRHKRVSTKRRILNLARLSASFIGHPSVTRTDKLRFLRAYLQWGLRGRGGWKKWWRRIDLRTKIKVRKNQRRGRPLA